MLEPVTRLPASAAASCSAGAARVVGPTHYTGQFAGTYQLRTVAFQAVPGPGYLQGPCATSLGGPAGQPMPTSMQNRVQPQALHAAFSQLPQPERKVSSPVTLPPVQSLPVPALLGAQGGARGVATPSQREVAAAAAPMTPASGTPLTAGASPASILQAPSSCRSSASASAAAMLIPDANAAVPGATQHEHDAHASGGEAQPTFRMPAAAEPVKKGKGQKERKRCTCCN